jgi:hypothetical protein
MLEPLFFALGLVNNLALITIFIVRGRRLDLIERYGWLYLLLSVPAVYAIVLAQQQDENGQYTIFLVIYLAFLAFDAVYDWILKIPFRESMNWRVLAPYVALYISSSYGFVVMVWKESAAGGLLMLGLTVAQFVANALTHPR